jgi:hypothetical protein
MSNVKKLIDTLFNYKYELMKKKNDNILNLNEIALFNGEPNITPFKFEYLKNNEVDDNLHIFLLENDGYIRLNGGMVIKKHSMINYMNEEYIVIKYLDVIVGVLVYEKKNVTYFNKELTMANILNVCIKKTSRGQHISTTLVIAALFKNLKDNNINCGYYFMPYDDKEKYIDNGSHNVVMNYYFRTLNFEKLYSRGFFRDIKYSDAEIDVKHKNFLINTQTYDYYKSVDNNNIRDLQLYEVLNKYKSKFNLSVNVSEEMFYNKLSNKNVYIYGIFEDNKLRDFIAFEKFDIICLQNETYVESDVYLANILYYTCNKETIYVLVSNLLKILSELEFDGLLLPNTCEFSEVLLCENYVFTDKEKYNEYVKNSVNKIYDLKFIFMKGLNGFINFYNYAAPYFQPAQVYLLG